MEVVMKKLMLTILALTLIISVNAQGRRGQSRQNHSYSNSGQSRSNHQQSRRQGTHHAQQSQRSNHQYNGHGTHHGNQHRSHHTSSRRYQGSHHSTRYQGSVNTRSRSYVPRHSCTSYCGSHGHYRSTRYVNRYYQGSHCDVVEGSYWIPGAWVYTNGCRTWSTGYWDWRIISRNNHSHGRHGW